MKIGLFPGSLKPPHAGHWAAIEQASKKCDLLYLLISPADRKRPGEVTILGKDMMYIWKKYLKKYLPKNTEFMVSPQPVKDVFDTISTIEKEDKDNTYIIFGDIVDVNARFNPSVLEKQLPGVADRIEGSGFDRNDTVPISGTKMRQMLSKGDKGQFTKFLPQPLNKAERVAIYELLKSHAELTPEKKKRKVKEALVLEKAKPGKNTHLTHLEDLIIDEGKAGIESVHEYLFEMSNELFNKSPKKTAISVKWDGAPATILGKNPENGKFFVATKGAFAKNPKLNYSIKDIKVNHADKTELQNKLALALTELEDMVIPGNAIIQGDFLFSKNDVKIATIGDEKYYTFRPNTITYAAPVNSELGKKISRSKFGIVFHTYYTGNTVPSLQAHFGFDAGKLKNVPDDVLVLDAMFEDVSGAASLTDKELQTVRGVIFKLDDLNSKLPKKFDTVLLSGSTSALLNVFFNHKIKTQGEEILSGDETYDEFIKYLKERAKYEISQYKTEKMKLQKKEEYKTMITGIVTNRKYFEMLFTARSLAIIAKRIILTKMNAVKNMDTFFEKEPGVFEVTDGEGFVAISHAGKAVKFIDRLSFSLANFSMPKNWG